MADLELLLVGLVMAASGERSFDGPEDLGMWMDSWGPANYAFDRAARALGWRVVGSCWEDHPEPEAWT